jgi:hypothetical protein
MQAYTAKIKTGAVQMLGINRETEPQGMIRAAFDLLDHFRDQTTHPVMANVMLGLLYDGRDLSRANFDGFVKLHQETLGRVPVKQYGMSEEPIRPGHGKREFPPMAKRVGKDWPKEEWERWNEERCQRWRGMIRVEMDRRGWSVEELSTRTELVLTNLPARGYKPTPITADDRTARKVEKAVDPVVHAVREGTQTTAAAHSDLSTKIDALTQIADALAGAVDQLLDKVDALTPKPQPRLPNRVPHEKLVAWGLTTDSNHKGGIRT